MQPSSAGQIGKRAQVQLVVADHTGIIVSRGRNNVALLFEFSAKVVHFIPIWNPVHWIRLFCPMDHFWNTNPDDDWFVDVHHMDHFHSRMVWRVVCIHETADE